MAVNRCLNCACCRGSRVPRTGCGEQKRPDVPPGSGEGCGGRRQRGKALRGGGANDRGGAAPAAATARKLMPAPSTEPLLPASDAPVDKSRQGERSARVIAVLSIN